MTKKDYFTDPVYGRVNGSDGIVSYRVMVHITTDDDPAGYADIIGTFPNEKEANAECERLIKMERQSNYVAKSTDYVPKTARRSKVPGSGRKAIDPEGTKVITARLTGEQYLAWQTLGASWLRQQLQEAFELSSADN